MPTYEYACRTCGQRFEQRLRYQERLNTQICPACGSRESSLCLSAPAVHGSSVQRTGSSICPSTGQSCGCGKFH